MKILIADDDAKYRQSLQEVLEGGGNTVIIADDGEAAVTAYSENKSVDLVITDYNMPKKNGLAVIQEIREIQPKARIWLVSNAMGDEIKSAAIEAGAEQSMWKADVRNELRQWNII
jgi:CheY-like chemotaxis protein